MSSPRSNAVEFTGGYISELLDAVSKRDKEWPRGSRPWGNWRYGSSARVLVHEQSGYEVDVENCTTSARVLDWIAQVAKKRWASAEDVGMLVYALNELLLLQETLCSMGHERGPKTPCIP